MTKVQYTAGTIADLKELTEILYYEDYFGFIEDAKQYVEDLVLDIETDISIAPKKKAPEIFARYGKDMFYVSFRKNKRTEWYVFFNIENGVYIVRHIANNHSIAHLL